MQDTHFLPKISVTSEAAQWLGFVMLLEAFVLAVVASAMVN